MTSQYLRTYFAERDLPNVTYEVDHNDFLHILTTESVIEAIMAAPAREQAAIADTIRRIEVFNPAEIHGFMGHLATCLVRTQF